MVKFEWVSNRDPVAVWIPAYQDWLVHLREAIRIVLETRVPDIIDWMTSNAPWKDRTGFARSQLRAQLEEEVEYFLVSFSYGALVRYAVYLEYDHQGKYAILQPALDYWGPRLLEDLQEAFR